jgi:glutaredoxin
MKVLIYGRPNCSFCTKAKHYCEQNGLDYEYKTVHDDITVEQLTEMVGGPVRTVPQIFKTSGGLTEYIGGFDQLVEKL